MRDDGQLLGHIRYSSVPLPGSRWSLAVTRELSRPKNAAVAVEIGNPRPLVSEAPPRTATATEGSRSESPGRPSGASLTLLSLGFGLSRNLQRHLDGFGQLLPLLKRCHRIVELEAVGLDRREIDTSPFEESDRGRPHARRTDAAANGQILHLDLAEFGGNLLADVDSNHRDPALGPRIVEDIRKRGGMAGRLDDEVGPPMSQIIHRLSRRARRRLDGFLAP